MPSLPSSQTGKMLLGLRQKHVELKSEPGVLGKEHREVRHILDEHRSAYTADGKYSGLSQASLLCTSDLGGQAKRELTGAERDLQKCWLKGQSASRIHHAQGAAPASCLPATFSWGLRPTLAFHCPAYTCHQGLPGQGQVSLLPPLVHTHTSILPAWKLTSSKRASLSSRPCLSPCVRVCSRESPCSKGVLCASGWRGHSGSPDAGPELGMEGAPETVQSRASC